MTSPSCAAATAAQGVGNCFPGPTVTVAANAGRAVSRLRVKTHVGRYARMSGSFRRGFDRHTRPRCQRLLNPAHAGGGGAIVAQPTEISILPAASLFTTWQVSAQS